MHSRHLPDNQLYVMYNFLKRAIDLGIRVASRR
jgi:hypothetical protein